MLALLAFYLLTLLVEPPLISRYPASLHVIIALQASIGLALLLFIGRMDFFAILLIPPTAQSIMNFPRKTAYFWIGGICLVMEAVLLIHFPISDSVGFMIIYPSAIALFAGFCYLAMQAEEAQDRSEALLADLQVANRKLQDYAAQVQELTIVAERNRLARELHDSVTQIIFSLTLSAQSARILLDRDPSRAAAQLDHLQTLAQRALAEMRALIQQLHPPSIAEEGLVTGLRRLVSERQAQDGLKVDLQVRGERRLPANVEEGLYRVAQEALNNIVKHASTDQAVINLDLNEGNRVMMGIEDAGAGFDLEKARSASGHLGLTSMAERIQALGGKLDVDSQPGKGTRIRVELALEQEVNHA
jgi:signal transduction histidine kinase